MNPWVLLLPLINFDRLVQLAPLGTDFRLTPVEDEDENVLYDNDRYSWTKNFLEKRGAKSFLHTNMLSA